MLRLYRCLSRFLPAEVKRTVGTQFPAEVKHTVGTQLIHQAVFMSELSIVNIILKGLKPSQIAFGAMLQFKDCLGFEMVPPLGRATFVEVVL